MKATAAPPRPADVRAASPRRRTRLRALPGSGNATALIGGTIVTVTILVALLAPLIAPDDPLATNPSSIGLGPFSHGHLLGTDEVGRDILNAADVRHPARPAGRRGADPGGARHRRLPRTALRLCRRLARQHPDARLRRDVLLSRDPARPRHRRRSRPRHHLDGHRHGGGHRPRVRPDRPRQRHRPAPRAVRGKPPAALGYSHLRIAFRHITPNLLGGVVVFATLQTGRNVILSSSLAFLGLGAQPPTPTGARCSAADAPCW